jgi:hypothetical protein
VKSIGPPRTRLERPVLACRFKSRKQLSLAEGDAAAVDAGYGVLTLDS